MILRRDISRNIQNVCVMTAYLQRCIRTDPFHNLELVVLARDIQDRERDFRREGSGVLLLRPRSSEQQARQPLARPRGDLDEFERGLPGSVWGSHGAWRVSRHAALPVSGLWVMAWSDFLRGMDSSFWSREATAMCIAGARPWGRSDWGSMLGADLH
jgi:hypothetical protein